MNLKLSPLKIINIFLALFTLGALYFNNFSQSILLHLTATLGLGLALFFILKAITKQPKSLYNAITTSLIIFLVLHSNSPAAAILATAIAIFSKFFLEKKGTPVINPAVLGILASAGILTLIQGSDPTITSWWGTNYGLFNGFFTLGLLAIWVTFYLKQWRKYTTLFTFLTLNAAGLYLLKGAETLQFIYTDATIYFFAAIMLIEPRTCPGLKKDQYTYGILAAILYNLFDHLTLPHFKLLTIAAVNFVFFLKKQLPKKALPVEKA